MTCLFCNQNTEYHPQGPLEGEFICKCRNCGNYRVSDEFKRTIVATLSLSDKSAISGYIRECNESSKSLITIDTQNYTDIINSSVVARQMQEKFDKLILYTYRKTKFLTDYISIDFTADYAICYARNPKEFTELNRVLQAKGLIDSGKDWIALTHQGFEHAETLISHIPKSDSAFVAMWFSPEMLTAYDAAIKPAIESEECGKFKAFRVDNHEHNNDITDEIIAGIKACRFMVADMTGYRGGVYYEAGFARGLGKPVIYTCRKDWFDGELPRDGKPAKERIHFDINHMNIIVWDDPEDLKKRIINRIRATII